MNTQPPSQTGLWTKWLWVRIKLLSLKFKIWCLLRARSSFTFRQIGVTLKLVRDMIMTCSPTQLFCCKICEAKNQRKLDISRPIYFLKNSTSFCRSYLYKQAGRIFFKTVVFKDLNLFWRQQHDWFGHHLFLKSYLSHTSYLKVLGHSEHLGIWSFETLYLADPSLVDTRSRFNVYKTPIQRHQLRIDVL